MADYGAFVDVVFKAFPREIEADIAIYWLKNYPLLKRVLRKALFSDVPIAQPDPANKRDFTKPIIKPASREIYTKFTKTVLMALPRGNSLDAELYWIQEKDQLRQTLHKAFSDKPDANIYPVYVNYDEPLENKTSYYSCEFERNTFPLSCEKQRKGEANIILQLMDFDRKISTDGILKDFESAGLRPADVYELMSLVNTYPEVHDIEKIVALGSIDERHKGHHAQCLLRQLDSRPFISFIWTGDRIWNEDASEKYRFVAVRKYQ
jgi:hypothetical protein